MSEKTELVVREATDEDCVAIYDLMKALAEYYKDGDKFKLTVDDLKQIGFNDKSYLRGIVAEAHSNGSKEIIGCIVYYYLFEVYRGRGRGSTGLMIKPRFRRMGVASQIRKAFCLTLLKNDIKFVNFLMDSEDLGSSEFYKHLRPIDVTSNGNWRQVELRLSPAELRTFSEGAEALPIKSLL